MNSIFIAPFDGIVTYHDAHVPRGFARNDFKAALHFGSDIVRGFNFDRYVVIDN